MRCYNCGWNNPDNVTKCQKCNQELVPDSSFNTVSTEPAIPVQNSFNKTVIATPHSSNYVSQKQASADNCPNCGYPLSLASSFCPNCGADLRKPSANEMNKTVLDVNQSVVNKVPDLLKQTVRDSRQPIQQNYAGRLKVTIREIPEGLIIDNNQDSLSANTVSIDEKESPSIKLVPLDNFDGKTSHSVEITGADVKISSKDAIDGDASIEEQQIEFSCVDGQWSVASNQDAKSVYVCTANSVKIDKGDIIVIGNRRFKIE